MIFAFAYKAFVKPPSVCCSADFLGQHAIPLPDIRLAGGSWQQESG